MSAKKRTPKAGDTVIVKHENSEESYFFDGTYLVDSTGREFSPFKDGEGSDWNKLWNTDKNWRLANVKETISYANELKKNGYGINYTDHTVSEAKIKTEELGGDSVVVKPNLAEIEISYDFVPNDDYPYNHTFKDTDTSLLQDYKNEIVRLWKLVEEMGTMADCSVSGCDKLTDRKFGLIGEKAVQRFRNVKSDGYNLFFKGEKITNNNDKCRIYDYGK